MMIDVNKALLDGKNVNTEVVSNAMQALRNINTDKKLVPISLADVRHKALVNNLNLKVNQFDPKIANEKLNIERAKFDNIIFANAKYGRKDFPKQSADLTQLSTDNTALNNQVVKLNSLAQKTELFDAELGIKIPLRTGATVVLSTPFTNKEGLSRFGKDEYNSALRFSVSQPLLRNAGILVNEASINIADLQLQSQQARTRLQSIRIIAIIDKAYWALNQAWVELEIRTQQYQYASENLNMVKKRVQEGLSAAVEINRAEIGVADRMEQLILASTNLQLAERQLKYFLNDSAFTLESDNGFIPETNPSLVQYGFDTNKLIEQALSARLDLLDLELKLSEDVIRISYLENQTLPIFTLDYSYGALSNTNSSFSNSLNQLGRFDDWYVGFKFEIPVTNEARKAHLNQAVEQRLQRLSNKSLQTLTVKKEILDALDIQNQHWQRILTMRQQVIIAGLNYEAEIKQFKEGLRTMTEVLEMLTRLGEVQMKEIKAVTDYQVAQIDLAFATGTLLGYSQVNFQ